MVANQRVRRDGWITWMGVLALLGILIPAASALPPAGYTEYYVPGSEQQMWDIFYDINPSGLTPPGSMRCVISIVALTDNTTIYYDHWEDTYDFNPASPSSADATWTLNQGQVQRLDSTIPLPRGTTTFYDGRDRIYIAGGPVTITRASWPSAVGTVNSLLWEILPTTPFLTYYSIPVGENLFDPPKNYLDFTKCYVIIQSLENGNTINIYDASDNLISTTPLNQGEVTQYFHHDAGIQIESDYPVQVQMLSGISTCDYMTRGFTCIPQTLWDNEYYSPIPGFASSPVSNTDLYIFNPYDTALTMYWEESGASGSYSISAHDTISYYDMTGHYVPTTTGVHLYTANESETFWAVGSSSSETCNWEWGFALMPARHLTDEYQIAWAPGTSDATPTSNGSPVFVTPIEDYTVIYVDYGLNNGNPSDGIIDATYTLNRLQVQRIFDPDNDNTGMNIWATGPIAVAWGEDPLTAGASSPYLDLGYTSLSVPEDPDSSVIGITKSVDQSVVAAGTNQVLTFTLVVESSTYSVDDVDVIDTLPSSWSYIGGSTTITYPDSSTANTNPTILGQDLTWDLNLDMAPNQTLTIVYQVQATTPSPSLYYRNVAEAVGYRTVGGSTQTFRSRDQTFTYVSQLTVTKVSDVTPPVVEGQTINYTMTITSSGTALVDNVMVTDPVPAYTSYLGPVQVITNVTNAYGTFRDNFNAISFTGSNGTQAWLTNWTEVGESDGAGNGDVVVTTDISNYQLRLRDNDNGGEGVVRSANLSAYNRVFLTFDYRRVALDAASDHVLVQISTNGTTFNEVGRIAGPTNDTVYQKFFYDLAPAYITSNTRIRLITSSTMGGTDIVYFDNIQLECYNRSSQVFTGNAPPNLVIAADNHDLLPGETMTVIMPVQVVSPIPPEVEEIVNTVSVTYPIQKNVIRATVRDTPTAALIAGFTALNDDGRAVITWETASETGTVGFVLERRNMDTREFEPVHPGILPGLLDAPQGGYYRYIDSGAQPGDSYTYRLIEIETAGKREHGPFYLTVPESALTHYKSAVLEPMTKQYQKQPRMNQIVRRPESRATEQTLNELLLPWDPTAVYPEDALKIRVSETGIQFVSARTVAEKLHHEYDTVWEAMLDADYSLTRDGESVAYTVDLKMRGIVFYGETSDSLYVSDGVYLLRYGDGLVMDQIPGTGPAFTSADMTFTDTLHLEENHYAMTAIATDPESDFWAWDYVFAGLNELSIDFTVRDIAATGTAWIGVNLIGSTDTSSNPDHHARILLNGVPVAEDTWDGITPIRIEQTFNQDLLNEGVNTLTVIGLTDTGAPYSLFYLDAIDIDYQRFYTAIGDHLAFCGESNPTVVIDGFGSDALLMLNVTEPMAPVIDQRVGIEYTGAGYRVAFAPETPTDRYVITSAQSLIEPEIEMCGIGYLRSPANVAESIVIAPRLLASGADALARFHQAAGTKAVVVYLDDIFNEFGYGAPDPWSIRSFLIYASQNWKIAPHSVILLGNGTYDYQNFQGCSDNLIPVVMKSTPFGLFASDGALADFNNDGVPEMAIGRIPALSNDEVFDFVAKLSTYRSAQGVDHALFAADDPDAAGDFPANSNMMASLMPANQQIHSVNLNQHSLKDARDLFVQHIESGVDYVNYIGHGGLDRYAEEGLFVDDDAAGLTNSPLFPIFANMTCSTGRFELPGFDCINEILVLNPTAGSLAVFSPTGLSVDQYALVLNSGLIDGLYVQDLAIGDAANWAKLIYADYGFDSFMFDIYNILGDPLVGRK